jgi:hypothetical protein
MAAPKRTKKEVEQLPPPKRQTRAAASNRPTRNSYGRNLSQTEPETQLPSKRDPPVEEDAGDSSDSSSLSDPPSTVASPTPPDTPITKPIPKTRGKVPAQRASLKKVSAKDHEEALNLFVRDSSDEESDSSCENKKVKGKPQNHELSEEDDDTWEDIDLSHRKEFCLDDLNIEEGSQDFEVTLERTQQSMRLKYDLFSIHSEN